MAGSTRKASHSVPLTGADCFLRAFDEEVRRNHGASHVSQLVLRLGPGFDVGRLKKGVDEVARAQPLVRAPIRRPFGVGAPVYQIGAAAGCPTPPVAVHESERPAPDDALPELFSHLLNQPMRGRRGELLRFDVVRYAGGRAGSDLAVTWLHMLLDGAGSERFVQWLDECFRGDRSAAELPLPDELSPRPGAAGGPRERGRGAMAWQRWVKGFGRQPAHSLAGPPRRVPQRLRSELLVLSPDESRRAMASAQQRAGFLTPMLFYLAATLRAHHAVFRARGQDPGSYLVPLPVNVRPRGSEGAIFRTHVSLLWFQARPEQVDDFDALLALLKQQRVAAIKSGHVENGVAAMEFARFAPARLYARLARSHHRGELCSFFFAYTGEFLAGLESFLGAPVRSGFHVAPVPPSPGSCLAISLHGGRLHATHVFQQGVLSDAERELFRTRLRQDLAR